MKREAYVLVLAFLIAFISVPTFAQNSLKIAVADTDKAFKDSIWGKKVMEELEKETEGWQERGKELDREISALEEQLAKQRAFLEDEEAEQKLLNEIESKKMEGRELIQEGNMQLTEKQRELVEPVLEEIKGLIKKLSMEEGYDVVLEKQLIVLYVNPELDITNRVTVMLDKVYKENASDKVRESEEPVLEQSEGKD